MQRLLISLTLVGLFCIPSSAASSMMTDKEFLRLHEDGQEAYVSGVVDGFSVGALRILMEHASRKEVVAFLQWYKECVSEKTPKKISEILRLYIKNHANTGEDAGVADDLINAINESCK